MVTAGASARVAGRLLGRDLVGERPVTVDQTNESVIVADQAVVKWLRPPVPSPHPGAELLAHLKAVGFFEMPAFIGIHEHDGMVEAIVTEYVPDSLDGWDWLVDDIDAWVQGLLDTDRLLAIAWRVGELAAHLHTALAGLQRATIGTRTYHADAIAMLDEALRIVDGEEGRRLRALEPSVRAALEPLRGDRMLPAHRVHGDLHIGQFLRSGSHVLVTDFDGNPLSDSVQRRLPQSPLRDLAQLLQSIDHAGRIVVKRRHPDRGADVALISHLAIEQALGAYRADHAVDAEVLAALRVSAELHEYLYAARHLPRWMYVPDAAMPALLGA